MITRDQALKQIAIKSKTVTVDGWGEFKIRQMRQSEAAKLGQWTMPKGKLDEDRAAQRNLKMITICVIDDDGNPLFDESDIPALESQPTSVVSELHLAILDINNYLDEEEKDALLGKSESCSDVKSDSSTSDSPES